MCRQLLDFHSIYLHLQLDPSSSLFGNWWALCAKHKHSKLQEFQSQEFQWSRLRSHQNKQLIITQKVYKDRTKSIWRRCFRTICLFCPSNNPCNTRFNTFANSQEQKYINTMLVHLYLGNGKHVYVCVPKSHSQEYSESLQVPQLPTCYCFHQQVQPNPVYWHKSE